MANILVVGGASGVGSALAEQLLARGDRVVASVRTAGQIEMVKGRLPALADVIELDLSDPDSLRAKIDAASATAPDWDAVVLCAAVQEQGALETITLDDIRRPFETNVVAALAIYQAVIAALRRTKGRLVVISSMNGKITLPLLGPYQISKFGLEALGDTMRQEAAGFGVKVVLILPGGIETPMLRNTVASLREKEGALSEEHEALYGHHYRALQARLGGGGVMLQPGDVAGAVIESLEAEMPESRYILGRDAIYFIQQRQKLSDPDMDMFIARMFSATAH